MTKKYYLRSFSAALSALMLFALMPVAGVSAGGRDFIIDNPYAGVDWETYGQYRAALHTHTTRSDGTASIRDVIADHYNKGFDIIAITDHDVICTGNWNNLPVNRPRPMGGDWSLQEHAMPAAERGAVLAGTFTGPFPAASGFTARGGGSAAETRRGQENGMIAIPFANEQSQFDDIVTLWGNFISAPWWEDWHNGMRPNSEEAVLEKAGRLGGLAILPHLGRTTGGAQGGAAGEAASNNPENVARYVDWFRQFDAAAGIEVINRLDCDTRSDRILWDNLLRTLMPYGRPVWGFAADDSHSLNAVGYAWTVMLQPRLTHNATRAAMESGAFYAVTRIDRGLGINATLPNGNPMPRNGNASTLHLLDQTPPGIGGISAENNQITIQGRDYDRIEWVTGSSAGGGQVIATGETLCIDTHWDSIHYNYVRAQVISAYGVAYTNPFGIREYGTELRTPPPVVLQWDTVRFDLNGGNLNGRVSEFRGTVRRGRTFRRLPAPAKANHTFAGWFTARTGGDRVRAADISAGNLRLFARWTPVPRTVTFKSAATGNVLRTRTPRHGSTVAQPAAPTRRGYTFRGWFRTRTGNGRFNFSTAITADRIVWAQFTRNPGRPERVRARRSGARRVRLTWRRQNGVRIEIQHRVVGGQWRRVTTTRAGASSWTSRDLFAGRYSYRIRGIRTINGRAVRSRWSVVRTVRIR